MKFNRLAAAWVLTVSYPGGRTKPISLSAEQKFSSNSGCAITANGKTPWNASAC
jgi:hypothetical protein